MKQQKQPIKQQKLSEYGVGPEEDHVIVVNQAKGVDAMMPGPRMLLAEGLIH
jgi:hypothetical protein